VRYPVEHPEIINRMFRESRKILCAEALQAIVVMNHQPGGAERIIAPQWCVMNLMVGNFSKTPQRQGESWPRSYHRAIRNGEDLVIGNGLGWIIGLI